MTIVVWEPWNDGEAEGFVRSAERRFTISPKFRQAHEPKQFRVRDHLVNTRDRSASAMTFDTVADCQAWAERRVTKGDSND